MRSNTEVVGRETSPETGNSFTSNRLLEAVDNTLVREDTIGTSFLFLDLGLDVIERERSARSSDSRNHRCSNIDSELTSSLHGMGELLLDSIVGDKHGSVKSRSSGHGGDGSFPESRDTFLNKGTLKGI